jgi:hypothetical protein
MPSEPAGPDARLATAAGPVEGGSKAALAWVLGAVVFLVGTWLRWRTLRSIPGFFGPGDPAIYFGMGRGILREGTPVQDFLHHYLTLPAEIAHFEDYYEPAFGYLVAAAMAIAGGTPQAAAGLSFVAGVVGIAVAGRIALAWGRAAAVIAAAIVALEPWSIYYSGILMKETVVALATLGVMVAVARLAREPGVGTPLEDGALVAVAAFAAGLLQFESIPLLGVACFVTLLLHRRRSVLPYLGTMLLLVGALACVTWWGLGIPISAKVLYVLGADPNDPFRAASAAAHARPSMLPLDYIVRSTLEYGYPLIFVLGLCGMLLPGANALQRTWIVTFVLAHLWLHGIPRDLWSRDFIVLTALLAAPAAGALGAWRNWAVRPAAGGLAGGTAAFLWLTPPLSASLSSRFAEFARLPASLRLAAMLVVFGLFGAGLGWVLARTRLAALSLATSLLLSLSLLGQFWLALPYPSIPLNPQFPDFEIERARRQRACEWMRSQVPRAPVVAERAEEVAWYSGFPAAAIPLVFRRDSFRALVERYRVRYVLAPEGLVPDSILAAIPVRRVGESEGHTLWMIADDDTTVRR